MLGDLDCLTRPFPCRQERSSILRLQTQKMNSLRQEQEETQAKYEEIQKQVKGLEQENLAKEHEISSLTHKNGLLEAEVEKQETIVKDLKIGASENSEHGTQNEALQRRLQLLEDEAEESDKNLRETNEKYAILPLQRCSVAQYGP